VQVAQTLDTIVQVSAKLDYLLHLPEGYAPDGPAWPLILFLHGAGERGDDLAKLRVNGIPRNIENQPDFPFIVASPQCPESSFWTQELLSLKALLDDLVARYNVDESRIYLTGLSMGGFGTWHLACTCPERFAAIAPICGGLMGPAVLVSSLARVPTWVFHGGKDPVVDIEQSQRLVDQLESVGGDVRFTIYPKAEHDSWTETYDNAALYEWFLAHTL